MLTAPAIAHPGHSPVHDRSVENRDYWIERAAQVHGGLGSLVALGIRLGDSAMQALEAERRELDVTVFSGKLAPCPCIADGIMVVTMASPGQGTLRVAAEPAEDGSLALVRFRHRKTGKTAEFRVPDSVLPLMQTANTQPVNSRWSIVMDAPEGNLFSRVTRIPD